MPSTKHGRESPVPPRTLPAYQGLEAFIHAWQLSWNRGVRFIFPPQRPLSFPAALVCLGCLPAHPSASSQAWNFRALMESKRGVGLRPSQRLLQTHLPWLGLGQPGTQSKKPIARGHVAQTKKTFVQKASKEDGGCLHTRSLCVGRRRGTEGPVSSWGWSEPSS